MKPMIITEGKASLKAYTGKISKELPVFYNPIMKFNRDISILLLNSIEKEKLQIADPLAGTAIRSIRFLLELKKNKITNISINDNNPQAVKAIKENLRLNKLKTKNIITSNAEASLFLLNSKGFDYIDIDPFGSPNAFLDAAIKRLSRTGILAITATDTAPLAGTYPQACLRKYWATPMRNELMHEIGLRILIRKIQLVAAQYDKALTPTLAYYKDHYFRVFFANKKGKSKCDKIIAQHSHFLYCPSCLNRETSKSNNETCNCGKKLDYAGPLWTGQLFDKKLIKKIIEANQSMDIDKFLKTSSQESKIKTVGFFDLHKIAKKYKKQVPKTEPAIKKLKKHYQASPTIFSSCGIRTTANIKELIQLLFSRQ